MRSTTRTTVIAGNAKVNPEEIPDEAFDTACRILKTSIRRYFEMPGVKEEYTKL